MYFCTSFVCRASGRGRSSWLGWGERTICKYPVFLSFAVREQTEPVHQRSHQFCSNQNTICFELWRKEHKQSLIVFPEELSFTRSRCIFWTVSVSHVLVRCSRKSQSAGIYPADARRLIKLYTLLSHDITSLMGFDGAEACAAIIYYKAIYNKCLCVFACSLGSSGESWCSGREGKYRWSFSPIFFLSSCYLLPQSFLLMQSSELNWHAWMQCFFRETAARKVTKEKRCVHFNI